MIRRLLAWWLGRREATVSAQWRHEHAQRDGREGFDGPVWRTPQELARWKRLERRRDLRLVKRA
jgi:hypothetical protein